MDGPQQLTGQRLRLSEVATSQIAAARLAAAGRAAKAAGRRVGEMDSINPASLEALRDEVVSLRQRLEEAHERIGFLKTQQRTHADISRRQSALRTRQEANRSRRSSSEALSDPPVSCAHVSSTASSVPAASGAECSAPTGVKRRASGTAIPRAARLRASQPDRPSELPQSEAPAGGGSDTPEPVRERRSASGRPSDVISRRSSSASMSRAPSRRSSAESDLGAFVSDAINDARRAVAALRGSTGDGLATGPPLVLRQVSSDETWSAERWGAGLGLCEEVMSRVVDRLEATMRGAGGSRARYSFLQSLGLALGRNPDAAPEVMLELLRGRDEGAGLLRRLAHRLADGARALSSQAAADARELHNIRVVQQPRPFEYAFPPPAELERSYFQGLAGFLGECNTNFEATMHYEHCCCCDSHLNFYASNYGTTTTSETEWAFVVSPESRADFPKETMLKEGQQGRQKRTLSSYDSELERCNTRLRDRNCEALMRAELIGVRLYTGPMHKKYNATMRGINAETARPANFEEWRRLCLGNSYRTTVYTISSAVIKLSKLTNATPIYRGLSGGVLPESFWTPDDFGVRGGVELALMSATTDYDVALFYASQGGPATILEMRCGLIDRGADLSILSQYPFEKEIVFPPLCALEVISTRIEMVASQPIMIVAVQHTINLTNRTLEQMLERRKKLLEDMADGVRLELWEALRPRGAVEQIETSRHCISGQTAQRLAACRALLPATSRASPAVAAANACRAGINLADGNAARLIEPELELDSETIRHERRQMVIDSTRRFSIMFKDRVLDRLPADLNEDDDAFCSAVQQVLQLKRESIHGLVRLSLTSPEVALEEWQPSFVVPADLVARWLRAAPKARFLSLRNTSLWPCASRSASSGFIRPDQAISAREDPAHLPQTKLECVYRLVDALQANGTLEELLLDTDRDMHGLRLHGVTVRDNPLPVQQLTGADPVTSLALHNRHFGVVAAIVIARLLASNTVLRSLDLSGSDFGARQLPGRDLLPSRSSAVDSRWPEAGTAVHEFAVALRRNRSLAHLKLSRCSINDDGLPMGETKRPKLVPPQ